jgi:hypothetical protein
MTIPIPPPSLPSSQQLAVEVPHVGTLSLVFERRGDRLAHAIWLKPLNGNGQQTGEPPTLLLLESVEGSSDDHWPASPPLQSLSIESFVPGTSVALLVGMAGNSHWSASIEPCREPTGFLFDLACRTTASAAFLGSTYRLADGMEASPLADVPHSAMFTCGDKRLRLLPEPAGAYPPPAITIHGNQLRLQAATSTHRTIRWKYRIGI